MKARKATSLFWVSACLFIGPPAALCCYCIAVVLLLAIWSSAVVSPAFPVFAFSNVLARTFRLLLLLSTLRMSLLRAGDSMRHDFFLLPAAIGLNLVHFETDRKFFVVASNN